MVQPRTGVVFNRKSDDPRPAVLTDMATVYLEGTSEDATAEVFPLNTLVIMNSSDTAKLAALGTGALKFGMQLINAQLGPFQLAARVIVNRVAKGATDAETLVNLIGDQAAGTGIYAALRAGNQLGVIPRLHVFPDALTGLFDRAPDGTVVTRLAKFGGNTGAGLMTLAAPAYGADAKPGVYRVRCKTAAANGGVFSVVDPDGQVLADATVGAAYVGTHVRFTIADGNADFVVGDGFDVTVSVTEGQASANPLCAALPQVLNALLAHAWVDGPGTTPQDAKDWRETLSSDRLIPIDAFVAPVGIAPGTFTGGAAAAVGIQIAVDYTKKGIPSQSAAYQAVQGITALQRYDGFSLSDGANDGQELFSDNVGIIQRGESGVETAAASSGFVLIASDNAGMDEEWRFYNVTRMRDFINLGLLKLWRARIGKENITRHGVQAVLNDGIAWLGTLKTGQHIIDFRFGVGPGQNTPEQIRAGKFALYYKAEEASPLLLIEADAYRYRDALVTLSSDITVETNQLLSN